MKKVTSLLFACMMLTTLSAQETEKPEGKSCTPDIDVFIGYSYMTGFQEGTDLALALGGHLAMRYMLSEKFALALDASYHTKKENDLHIARMYLMGGVAYTLYAVQMKKQRDFLMYMRLIAGMAQDRLKYTYGNMSSKDKYNAFCAAWGMGFSYQLGNQILLSLLTDYIHTRFNDDGQSNIRASLGVTFRLGCK
jgi:hypothetical protein